MPAPELPGWRTAAELTGRRAECSVLDQLVQAVRAGESRALVVHGEAGVGKSALFEYLAAQSRGFRVIRAGGVESEMELPFATLHQVCAHEMHRADTLPAPQVEAVRTAFGISPGPRPDLFLVGLAVLGLLSEAAGQQPLLCLVDDQQWVDRASAQVLAFVARRLGAESVALVFAVRDLTPILAGLPDLPVGGLSEPEAGLLLDSALAGPVDARVRAQLIAEARGNPLALVELPRAMTPTDLAGGFGLPTAAALAGGLEDRFSHRADMLPEQTRQLLLVAAADPSGDAALLWRATASLAIGPESAEPAIEAGLAEFGSRVTFRHPLVRSAVYRSATGEQRRRAHRALAESTDVDLDPDRRAWHRSQAVVGPDAEVAEELERSAGRAQSRGGLAAAGAFLKQAATLTLDPALRAERALQAAEAEIQVGGFDTARELLSMADLLTLDDAQRARLAMLNAQLAFLTNRGNDAPPLLLDAARRLEVVDPPLSRATYLDAFTAAIFAGRMATPGGDVLAVARAARSVAPARDPRALDLMLEGTAVLFNDGYAASVPLLRQSLETFGERMSVAEELRLLYMAGITAVRMWDADRWATIAARHLTLARETGALSELHLALTSSSYLELFSGELAAAASGAAEVQAFMEATGTNLAPYVAMGLAAFRGDEQRAPELFARGTEDVTGRGEGIGLTFVEWAKATLYNGVGRYADALAAAQRAAAYEPDCASLVWVLPELVEAAVRTGAVEVAINGHRLLAEMAAATGTDWALGVEARCHALLAESRDPPQATADSGNGEGVGPEGSYREALAHLSGTRLRVDLARTNLLYGEWLRRQRRPGEAREQLRVAHSKFDTFSMGGFAERAARELRASGGTTSVRAAPVRHAQLTAQEAQIAGMAAQGLSNPEIGGRLFISARTVQYHLSKVFTKFDITSRSQLERVLAEPPDRGR